MQPVPGRKVGLCLEPFPDQVLNDNRGMGKMGELFAVRQVRPHQFCIVIEVHAVTVRTDKDRFNGGEREITDIHRRGNNHDFLFVLLALIGIGRKFWETELVADPMVTDLVPASEIAMGIIIIHTPPQGPGQAFCGKQGIEDTVMAEGMLTAQGRIVKSLCREHMAVELGHQIRRIHWANVFFLCQACVFSSVGKIIIGIHILQQMAFCKIPYTSGLPGRIGLVSRRVGQFIQRIIIRRFVDPYPPQDNARMVVITQNHIPDIPYAQFSPVLVGRDMLPSRDFLQHQQSKLITGIQKRGILRIMAGPDNINPKLLEANGIVSLHGGWHCIPYIRIALVTIQAHEFFPFSIEIKPIFFKAR